MYDHIISLQLLYGNKVINQSSSSLYRVDVVIVRQFRRRSRDSLELMFLPRDVYHRVVSVSDTEAKKYANTGRQGNDLVSCRTTDSDFPGGVTNLHSLLVSLISKTHPSLIVTSKHLFLLFDAHYVR